MWRGIAMPKNDKVTMNKPNITVKTLNFITKMSVHIGNTIKKVMQAVSVWNNQHIKDGKADHDKILKHNVISTFKDLIFDFARKYSHFKEETHNRLMTTKSYMCGIDAENAISSQETKRLHLLRLELAGFLTKKTSVAQFSDHKKTHQCLEISFNEDLICLKEDKFAQAPAQAQPTNAPTQADMSAQEAKEIVLELEMNWDKMKNETKRTNTNSALKLGDILKGKF